MIELENTHIQRSLNSYGFELQIFLHFLIMIQKTESSTLTDNPILGLESEIRALKETVRVMRDEMEAMGFARNQSIQETKLENAN